MCLCIGISVLFDLKWQRKDYSLKEFFWFIFANTVISIGLFVLFALFFAPQITSALGDYFTISAYLIGFLTVLAPLIIAKYELMYFKKRISNFETKIIVGYSGLSFLIVMFYLYLIVSRIPWLQILYLDKLALVYFGLVIMQIVVALVTSVPLIYLSSKLKNLEWKLFWKILVLAVATLIYSEIVSFVCIPFIADKLGAYDTLSEIGLFFDFIFFADTIYLIFFIRSVKLMISR